MNKRATISEEFEPDSATEKEIRRKLIRYISKQRHIDRNTERDLEQMSVEDILASYFDHGTAVKMTLSDGETIVITPGDMRILQ